MKTKRPKQITPHHLERLAVPYVRLATFRQGDDDGRVEAQRSEAEHARQWGWPAEHIMVLEDTGKSGANPDRNGYRRMCQMIEAGQVGVVLASDFSRLSRSAKDLLAFLRLCHKQGTLIAINGHLVDPSTIYLRESGSTQVAKTAGSLASQREVGEIFCRYLAEGKSISEIADEFNKRARKTTRRRNGR